MGAFSFGSYSVAMAECNSCAEELAQSLRAQVASSRHVRWPSLRYVSDPVGFCRDILGIEPWSRQCDILRSVATHDQVAMSSGRKCGKTTVMAALAWWWVATHERASVYLLAADGSLLEDVLWTEMLRLFRGSGRCVVCKKHDPAGPMPCEHSSPIGGRAALRSATGWTSDDGVRTIRELSMDVANPGGSAGRSGEKQLYLIDEANDVDDVLLKAVTGNCMGGGKVIMASNPRHANGMFYEAVAGNQVAQWRRFEISCLDTPNYLERRTVIPGLCSFEKIELLREALGSGWAKSAQWLVDVEGRFVFGEEGRVISNLILEVSHLRWGETVPSGPLVIGADVAGDGDDADETIVCPRRGNKIFELRLVRGGVANLAPAVRAAIVDYWRGCGKPLVVFDGLGRFGSKARRLLHEDAAVDDLYDVLEFNASHKIPNPQIPYYSRRDESWASFAQWLADGGTLPPDEKLVQELRYPQWERVAMGKSRVTSREDIVRGIGRSADRATAAILTVCFPEQYAPTVAQGPVPSVDSYAARATLGRGMDPYAERMRYR